MKTRKIVITGAHATPAFAVFEELKIRGGWEIIWIGTKTAFEFGGGTSFESQVLPKLGIPFYPIVAGKIHRGKIWETLFSLIRIPVGLVQSLVILSRIDPQVVLSFGGYITIPVAFAAWILGIPVVIHEQTTASGLANRLVARVAEKVAISNEISKKYFPREKTVLTGNPVRRRIFEIAKRRNGKKKSQPVLYITGGSRGSRALNEVVFSVVLEITKLGKVYHQTGELDLARALQIKDGLSRDVQNNYIPVANFFSNPKGLEKILESADVVISRAGANIISELEVLGIPAVLIPIPWAEQNEQYQNAKILKEEGTGMILSQDKLSGPTLLGKVRQILKNSHKFKRRSQAFGLADPRAAKKITDLLYEVL